MKLLCREPGRIGTSIEDRETKMGGALKPHGPFSGLAGLTGWGLIDKLQ